MHIHMFVSLLQSISFASFAWLSSEKDIHHIKHAFLFHILFIYFIVSEHYSARSYTWDLNLFILDQTGSNIIQHSLKEDEQSKKKENHI